MWNSTVLPIRKQWAQVKNETIYHTYTTEIFLSFLKRKLFIALFEYQLWLSHFVVLRNLEILSFRQTIHLAICHQSIWQFGNDSFGNLASIWPLIIRKFQSMKNCVDYKRFFNSLWLSREYLISIIIRLEWLLHLLWQVMGIVLELTDCLSHPLAQSFFTHRISSINGGPFRIFSSIKSVTPCDLTDSPIKKTRTN